ncbi:carbohydrate binding domain-containing protein [Colwellia psychrerythraea]|nr:carbohydrate binding domain-containing protein [Colwellia psychrerythraea]
MNKIIKSLALVGMFAVAPQSLAMPNTVGSVQSNIGTDNTQKISSVDKKNEKIIKKANKQIRRSEKEINKLEKMIVKEEGKIAKYEEKIEKQEEKIAKAKGKNKENKIAKAMNEIEKSNRKIERSIEKITQALSKIESEKEKISVAKAIIEDLNTPVLQDSDNDGVVDDFDSCPNTFAETLVDANGCSLGQLDSDNDGVNDDIDQCPDTAVDAVVDTNGCLSIPPTSDNGLPIINFEVGGTGESFSWNVFENVDNPAVQFVTNPESSGVNSSTTVAMFTARVDGAPWAGAETAHGNIGPITLDATNSIIKIMVYKTVISDVGLKLAIANGGAQPEIKVANTLINEWEELTFDFSGNIGLFESINVDQIIVFPDFNLAGRAQENVVYFDNITFNGNGADTGGGDTGTGGDGDTSGTIETITFEASGTGTAYSWNVFENLDNPAVEIVTNPDATGTNTSTSVAKFIARQGSAPWAGAESAHGDFGPLTLDASNSIVKIMVYKTVISDVGLKFSIASGGAQGEIKVANTLVNQWEELTFDFSGNIGAVESINIDQIIVFPDFDFARSQENVVYFDNISFSDGTGGGDTGTGGGDNGTGGGDTGTDGGDTGTEGELLTNSSFDNGTEGWSGGTVIVEGDNNIFTADVAAPGNPWDVNLSQVMTLVPDATYVLSFKAKASVARTIIAGLGLAHDPWTNTTETATLSTQWQSFTYTLTTSGFGDDNSRALFDMGSEAGTVYLDDISVILQNSDGGDTGTDGTAPSEDWSMVWNDEFDGSDIDLSKWEHEVNCSGGGNNEKQCYTSNPENSFVENGALKIVAKPESGQALPYSSARLRTKYKGDWKYGRVEVRAKPPRGQGSFPAIWMLPTEDVYGGWPHSGEIDIFESVNLKTINNQGIEEAGVHGNLWYGRSWPNQSNSGAHFSLPGEANPADGFHIYAIEWEEGEIRWYVDGYLYQTQLRSQVNIDSDGDANGLLHRGWFADYENEFHWDNSPFNQDFHLILNFAVGGSWSENVNNGGIDASAFNADNAFEFDYVRVYECSVDPITGQGCASVRDGYLDPISEGGSLVDGDAPTPIKPSTGEAIDLVVFDNANNESWPAWSSNEETTFAVVTDDVDHDQVVEFSMGAAPAVVGFNTSQADIPVAYDGSPMLNNGWLEFDMKLVTPPNNANANWNLKVEQGGTTTEALIQISTPTAEWQHYAISLNDLSNAGLELNGIDVIMIFPDWAQGEGAVFRVDNITILQGENTGGDSGSGGDTGDGDSGPVAGEEILSNGSFDNGTEGWIGAVAVNTEGDNTFYQADIAVAGNPWDVNLSQIMTLIPGETYVLSFKAKASIARSMIAGLGLNSDPWTNVTETVALTTEWQTYNYVFTIAGFGDDNSRVLFDLGAEAGSVYIDDVSVSIQANTDGNTGGGDTGGQVVDDEFVIISSTDDTDVSLTPDTIGEWSTGTVIQADVTFDGLMGWELTSSANSPEQGNWGTVLAFQNGILGDFSLFNRVELTLATSGGYDGGFKVAISANGVSKEISLPLDQSIATWQTISIDAADIPLNLSSIDWIAVYGIGGQTGVSTINVTDFSLIKNEAIAFDSETNDDFVFISSDADITSDLIVDDDNNSAAGNIIFGEWSTGTAISEINYSGLDAIQLTAGGGWGAVLALQGDISDGVNVDNYDVDMANYTNIKFKVASQGTFERYALSIVSKVGANETAQEVSFSLANPADWNSIDIDLAQYGVNLSTVNQMAVFGVYAGGSASQKIYITDMVLYDTGKVTPAKESSDDKFVFFSSSGESSDMIFDGDDSAHNGNTTISEWSTGTTLTSDVVYNGLNAFELTKGAGWGAVLALMGDTYGGVQEYKLDVAKYSTINFKIAAQGAFSAYFIDFIVDGAEFKVPVTVNSNWTEVSINVADIPLNLSKITQIAIFGEGGGVGNKIYITDLNISK